MKGQGT